MENEERNQLEIQHQKELESLKEDVARLTSLLEQALRPRAGEGTSSQPTFTPQPPPPFIPPSEPQHAAHFVPTQSAHPMRVPHSVLIEEEPQRNKIIEENGHEKLAALEERMKAIEGNSLYDPVQAAEMCLVPNVVIPRKFRVPEFVKYTGTQCPITHLKAYCNKMAEVVYDEKLLIHFFQDSLSDAALAWYTRLDNTKIKGWKDLVEAFIRQYKFNMDIAPDRSSLQAMEKGNKESVREYAQRWRESAAQVNPPLSEREMTGLFSNTFKAPYFEYLVGSAAQNFSDLVVIAERIEQAVRTGRIVDPTEKRGFIGKRKETEVHNVERESRGKNTYQDIYSFKSITPTPSISNIKFFAPTNTQNNPINNQTNNAYRPRRNFPIDQVQLPPLPMSLTEMHKRLLNIGQVAPVPLEPLQPPFPFWYKPDQKCEYHAGAVGHHIDGCVAFKRKILQLIKAGWISFDESLNVNSNPLPNHASGGGGVNSLEIGRGNINFKGDYG